MRGVSLRGLEVPAEEVDDDDEAVDIPLRLTELLSLAKINKMPNPLGRAIYIANRERNAGIGAYRDSLKALQSVRPETATRWLQHWLAGGSIKALKYTREQWREGQRAKREQHRERQREREAQRTAASDLVLQ